MTLLQDLHALNVECFLSDDTYSNIDYLEEVLDEEHTGVLTVRVEGKLAGYIIYREFGKHIESLRRGVAKKFRGKGLGVKLTKKLIHLSKHLCKPVYTYVATFNIASLNSNFKCGYKVTHIHNEWVYIKYTPPKGD